MHQELPDEAPTTTIQISIDEKKHIRIVVAFERIKTIRNKDG